MNLKTNKIPYTVYILECSNGAYYCGVAKDLEKRLEVHRSGKGSKYVRANLPFKVVYTRIYENKVEAMKEETRIKNLSRPEKEKLLQ